MRRRVAAVSISALLFLLALGHLGYELAARRALRAARDRARAALEDGDHEAARAAVLEWERRFTLTRLRGRALELRRAIDEEEKLALAHRSLAAEREASELAARGDLPGACERLRAAIADARNKERKRALEALLGPLEEKVRRGGPSLPDPHGPPGPGRPRTGHARRPPRLP